MKPKFETQLDISLLRHSRIPARFWLLQPSTYRGSRHALKAVAHYVSKFTEAYSGNGELAAQPVPGLLLQGPTNSYKTFLACRVLMHLMAAGLSVAYYTLEDLSDAYFGKLDNDTATFRNRIVSPDLVCFDNVNAPGGRGQKLALLRAVRIRTDEGKPYIICTRFDNDALTNLYGVVTEEPENALGGTPELFHECDLLNFFSRDLVSIKLQSHSFEIAEQLEEARSAYVLKPTVKVDSNAS